MPAIFATVLVTVMNSGPAYTKSAASPSSSASSLTTVAVGSSSGSTCPPLGSHKPASF